ncbi:MAG: DUF2070 family protein [Candidatus Bathyarchaeia archaeon]|jgi:putative membrane protein|nr:DUF2070 family protein [Candidatus Bathyarchaeota archaeon A05DMB-4]MDH7595775.1 DUF2070 family protein [Candidatus Bathyarchaeota archaeon]
MTSKTTQQDFIDQAVKRYSSLFTLPPHSTILFFLALLCIVGGFFVILPFTQAYLGILWGACLFLIIGLSDLSVCRLLRSEPVYNARRCNGLSLFSTTLWVGLMLIGAALGMLFQDAEVWLKIFLFGFCAVSLLRLLVYSATLFKGFWMASVAALLQPVLWVGFLYFTWPWLTGKSLEASFFLFPLVSIPIIVATILLFTFIINRVGKKSLGVSSMALLKAFLANWIEDVNKPLEDLLEALGTEQTVNVSLLAFTTENHGKAMIAVPALHPGPFKNVGSSPLPYMMQATLEKQLGCVTAVPHGLFGHELDLASQAQNHKVLEAVSNSLDFHDFADEASPFVHVKSKTATACCQIFGDCALLTLTVAPKTTEDLPQELGFLAIEEAKKKGLESAFVINAHNSIDDDGFRLEENINSLKKATVESLEKAAKSKRATLRVGAAKVVPSEFNLEDGMGAGGIVAIVVQVGKQTTVYVTIDGNNMVSGLREKILAALKDVGVDDGEVLTTDTHAVSAVVLNRRGYHPVGEVMDNEKLIAYIKKAVSDALGNLEPVKTSWRTFSVPNVKVIGGKQIEALCALTNEASKQAKKSAIFLFPVASAVLIALLLLL